MDLVTILGLLAGALTTISFWPQLSKTWKSKSAGDLSLEMLLTFTAGVLLWVAYGFYLNALPIILTNLVTFLLTLTILVLKIRYRS